MGLKHTHLLFTLWVLLACATQTFATAAEHGSEETEAALLRRRRQHNRELRQSIFCRCVADYEDFYTYDRRRELQEGEWPKQQQSKYYHYQTGALEKKAVVEKNDASEKKKQKDQQSKYYHPEYRQYEQNDATLGPDGYYIVDGITVLPLDNDACIVSQTDKALRIFLELYYSPRANNDVRTFWDFFNKPTRQLSYTTEGEQKTEVTNEDEHRDLKRNNWDERRKKVQQKQKRPKPNSIFDTDLSVGTKYEAKEIPRIFPCPPDAPQPADQIIVPTSSPTVVPSTAAPSISAEPTFAPISQIETLQPSTFPSLVPSDILSDYPSEIPSDVPSLSQGGDSLLTPSISPQQSLSPKPSVSSQSSLVPTITLRPTISLEPSVSGNPSAAPKVTMEPTVSFAPTNSLQPSDSPSDQPSSVPTISSQPTTTTKPSQAPSVSFQPSVSPQPTSDSTITNPPTTTTEPSQAPSVSLEPTVSPQPSGLLSEQPSSDSTIPNQPSQVPSVLSDSLQPNGFPSEQPSGTPQPSISEQPSLSFATAPSVTLLPTVHDQPPASLQPSFAQTSRSPQVDIIRTGTRDGFIDGTKSAKSNDSCSEAVPLFVDDSMLSDSYSGSITERLVWPNLGCGRVGGIDNRAPTVWFSVVGTGDVLEATTCSEQTNFSTAIQVMSGECMFLTCVAEAGSSSDDDCDGDLLSAKVSWQSVKGQDYKIMLFGRVPDGQSANYGLTLQILKNTDPD